MAYTQKSNIANLTNSPLEYKAPEMELTAETEDTKIPDLVAKGQSGKGGVRDEGNAGYNRYNRKQKKEAKLKASVNDLKKNDPYGKKLGRKQKRLDKTSRQLNKMEDRTRISEQNRANSTTVNKSASDSGTKSKSANSAKFKKSFDKSVKLGEKFRSKTAGGDASKGKLGTGDTAASGRRYFGVNTSDFNDKSFTTSFRSKNLPKL